MRRFARFDTIWTNYKTWKTPREQGFIQALTDIRLAEIKTQSFSFETQSLKPKNKKSNKNCLDCLERALFILFLPLEVINGVKSLYKEKNYSPENETCVRSRRLFLPHFFWIKLWGRFSNNPHLKPDPQPLHQRRSWTKV